MLIIDRQHRVLELLQERGTAELEELASLVGVSSSTVRRDLEALARRGQVERTHGGAVYTGGRERPGPTVALAGRMRERVEAKRSIGAYAASLVEPGMTLLLDGGSTVILAAEQIAARPLQVVTNSLSIANQFKDDDRVELLMIGGRLYPRTEVTLGPVATDTLQHLHADLLFFSLAGIFGEGLKAAGYNLNHDMARIEQVMIEQAGRSVMLMDSSKFGRKSLVRVCPVTDVDEVVTDAGVDAAWREALGGRLVVAE